MPTKKETVETRGLTNRDIALETRCRIGEMEHHLATINGTVADLVRHDIHTDSELYGDPDKQITGIKEHTLQNCDDLKTFKIAWKIIAAGLTALGALNITGAAITGTLTGVNLGDLDDVDLTGLANNDVLRYDSGTSTWKPEPA